MCNCYHVPLQEVKKTGAYRRKSFTAPLEVKRCVSAHLGTVTVIYFYSAVKLAVRQAGPKLVMTNTDNYIKY